jgi:hypothetical protein
MEHNSGGSGSGMPPWEYHLRKCLLLLATLVATVTYTGGLTLPGGVWQDGEDGHLAGDPILVFYYCNSAAFSASLVVILLILVLNKESRKLLTVLRLVMLLDLLGLLGAYVAGSCRDKFKTWYASVLVVLVFAYVVLQMLLAFRQSPHSSESPADHHKESHDILRLKERRKVLMLLATFMTTVTYVARLNSQRCLASWEHMLLGVAEKLMILPTPSVCVVQFFYTFSSKWLLCFERNGQ